MKIFFGFENFFDGFIGLSYIINHALPSEYYNDTIILSKLVFPAYYKGGFTCLFLQITIL
jgi:hypothetical protein